MTPSIGFEYLPNASQGGFAIVNTTGRSDEERYAMLAAAMAKYPASAPAARRHRSAGRPITASEARALLAARGTPEYRLRELFPVLYGIESRSVERRYVRGGIELR
jgi:hypothetical protein